MKKTAFIFGLHGVVFTLFTFLNILINDHVFAFLSGLVNSQIVAEVLDWLVSGFLYVGLYAIVYGAYKLITMRVKKSVLPIGGTWYHLHVKLDENGQYKKVDFLRAGETKIEQDLCDVHFEAQNWAFKLDENGGLFEENDDGKKTVWNSWAVDWQGKTDIATCYKATTLDPDEGVYSDRHGVHRLRIDLKCGVMVGKFADEYPSKNQGQIYFYRSKEKRDQKLLQVLKELKNQ
jgi:hypothetical protein